jgi:hypothetical protein
MKNTDDENRLIARFGVLSTSNPEWGDPSGEEYTSSAKLSSGANERRKICDQALQNQTDNWLTDPAFLAHLGTFDLDPCCRLEMPWSTASQMVTWSDGLLVPWSGRVWLKPPFSAWGEWLQRLADHGNGIGLLPVRTETRAFHELVFNRADGITFLKGQPPFVDACGKRPSNNNDMATCLVAYGVENYEVLKRANFAIVVPLKKQVYLQNYVELVHECAIRIGVGERERQYVRQLRGHRYGGDASESPHHCYDAALAGPEEVAGWRNPGQQNKPWQIEEPRSPV